MYISKIKIRII